MRSKIILFMLLITLSKTLMAQQALIDSLEKKLTTTMPDSNRARTMVTLAYSYHGVSPAKAHELYEKARNLAASKNLYYEQGYSYRFESFLLQVEGDYVKVRRNLDSAIYLFGKSNLAEARAQEALTLGDLSGLYRNLNDDSSAIQYALRSIEQLEKLNRKNSLSIAYINLSNLYKDLNLTDKQLMAAFKALQVAKEIKRPGQVFISYAFIAHAYNASGQYQKSKLYIDSAALYYPPNIDFPTQYSYHMIKASVFKYLKQYDSSFHYYGLCYTLAEKNNSPWNKIDPLLQMGVIHMLQHKYSESEQYLNRGLAAAIRDSSVLNQQEAYEKLSELYVLTNQSGKALEAYRQFVIMKDSLGSLETKKYITRLEHQFENARKEDHIRQLEADQKLQQLSIRQKNTLNYILIGSAVILLVISLLSYRNYKQKQKLQQQRINELEIEKKLMATEAVLKGEEQERSRLAKDLHDGLGGMLSGIKYVFQNMKGNLVMTQENHQSFERGMDMLDTSIKEMRRVAHNMMPEALVKFGLDTALKDFCNDINQSGVLKLTYQSIGMEKVSLDHTFSITIFRIVQELINNSIKHSAAKTAIVQLTNNEGHFLVTVEDDGRGFDTSTLRNSKGMGWNNIESRVGFLKGTIDLESNPGKGTSVHVEIPGI